MRLILLLILLPLFANTQVVHDTLKNEYTFKYKDLLLVEKEIEDCKFARQATEEQYDKLEEIKKTQEITIQKLELKDSLYRQEINLHESMNSLYRDKLGLYNDITNNYKILLFNTEDLLKVETKRAKKEKLWKNIYKYAYPAALGIAAGFILIK